MSRSCESPAAATVPNESTQSTGWSSTKLQPHHFEGAALVYVRQSTAQQVLNNRESTARQYSLVELAVQLGWPADRVEVIDEDQAQSGSTAEGREGFQRLLAEVGLDHVGIILGLELSRLARSNKDWHQLIELCAIFGTMLADQDGLYDPTDYNDRLLLGLRGIMNEAELHILQGRMHQALLSKAKRGEVYIRAPAGYLKLPTGEVVLEPDEQAQSVIRLIFDEFDRRGSIRRVLRFLQDNDVKLPIRPHAGPNKGQLEWRPATPSVVYSVLTHPLYAGTYRFGHRQTDPRRKKPGQPDAGRAVVPPEDYHALIPDHCPAYITRERFERNQRRILHNRFGRDTKGAPRNGQSLLTGILFCGRCGRRMSVFYHGVRNVLRYQCTTGIVDFRTSRCQSLSGQVLDELVAEKILAALEPAALELSLMAADDLENEQRRLDDNWRQRLERARFEADRARRQYQAVEPENRLVARELERQWEASLKDAQDLEKEYARFRQTHLSTLSDEQRRLIRSLSENLPTLWRASTTSCRDRQRIVRLLIERVEVTVQGTTEQVDASLHWSGGFASRHEVRRPVRCYEQTADYERLMDRIAELQSQGRSYAEIALRLNAEGFRPAKQARKFCKTIVGRLANKLRGDGAAVRKTNRSTQLKENEWTINDLAERLDMPRTTLMSWIKRGWAHASRQLPGHRGRILCWANADELDRLRQLRRTKRHFGDPPLPKELTTPRVSASSSS
ncbi:MAG: recombinase family protein [Pirellulales bacterium]